ncbi:uncharacterized protein LOC112044319 [Bicyclus anynana]|uniref:Uncharacterized protein LOC112044319 n=1 Tax=Bicyclus anynana TaxID=110368 RepID=A0A6J1MK84_BICAN|nr:uncharacterized protein LOC112044319 [Bicyclus anynana]
MLFRWLHKYIRRNTKPIPGDVAVLWKRRLSIAYAVLAWNAFGLFVYSLYQGKADWAHYYGLKSDEEHSMPPARAWANTLGIKNAKVVRISGFTKVDEYDIVDGEEVRKKENETGKEELSQ